MNDPPPGLVDHIVSDYGKSFNIGHALHDVSVRTDRILNELQTNPTAASYAELEKRISSMELLLFRCNLKEFEAIDKKISSSLDSNQPEPEISPQKLPAIDEHIDVQLADDCRVLPQCLNFDIYSENGDIDTEILETEPINTLQFNTIGCQTKVRVNGRAIQTERTTKEVATNTTMDATEDQKVIEYIETEVPKALESKSAIDSYELVANAVMEHEDDEAMAKLSSRDRVFVATLMSQFDTMIDQRLRSK